MLLLAADTSGKSGSIALAGVHAGTPDIEILEVVPLAGGTFSAQLVPQIASLLEKHGFSKTDVAGFAVASGPGSFTGLRVGLAAIKALGETLQKPIAAVSLLEAVAWRASNPGKVISALDAGRSQVYVGMYEVLSVGTVCRREELLGLGEFLERATGETVITPDRVLVDALRARQIPVEQVQHPRSDLIARLGWRKIEAGETVSAQDLEANYIRRSDAEITSNPGLKG